MSSGASCARIAVALIFCRIGYGPVAGAKIAEGDPEAVENDPRVIAAYLGSPEEEEVG